MTFMTHCVSIKCITSGLSNSAIRTQKRLITVECPVKPARTYTFKGRSPRAQEAFLLACYRCNGSIRYSQERCLTGLVVAQICSPSLQRSIAPRGRAAAKKSVMSP